MSKLHQIWHCTPLIPQPYTCQVWSQSDEWFLRYEKDIHTYVRTFLPLIERYFIVQYYVICEGRFLYTYSIYSENRLHHNTVYPILSKIQCNSTSAAAACQRHNGRPPGFFIKCFLKQCTLGRIQWSWSLCGFPCFCILLLLSAWVALFGLCAVSLIPSCLRKKEKRKKSGFLSLIRSVRVYNNY